MAHGLYVLEPPTTKSLSIIRIARTGLHTMIGTFSVYCKGYDVAIQQKHGRLRETALNQSLLPTTGHHDSPAMYGISCAFWLLNVTSFMCTSVFMNHLPNIFVTWCVISCVRVIDFSYTRCP